MDNQVEFGNLVKEFRRRSGMDPKELAEKSGVHQSFIHGIERGVQAPSLETAKKIFAAMSEDQQKRILWDSSFTDGNDLLLRDPRDESENYFEFTAEVKGQNTRPSKHKDELVLTHDEFVRLRCLQLVYAQDSKEDPEYIVLRARLFSTFIIGD
jgi:transcriptional regulator with XRE-family HTH domain